MNPDIETCPVCAFPDPCEGCPKVGDRVFVQAGNLGMATVTRRGRPRRISPTTLPGGPDSYDFEVQLDQGGRCGAHRADLRWQPQPVSWVCHTCSTDNAAAEVECAVCFAPRPPTLREKLAPALDRGELKAEIAALEQVLHGHITPSMPSDMHPDDKAMLLEAMTTGASMVIDLLRRLQKAEADRQTNLIGIALIASRQACEALARAADLAEGGLKTMEQQVRHQEGLPPP